MMHYYRRNRLATEFESWIRDPVREVNGDLIDSRYALIEDFYDSLKVFLWENGYSFGKNEKIFKRKLLYFWFFIAKACRKNMSLRYDSPSHRNHSYDFNKFCDTFDNEIFQPFLDSWSIEGFLDDSDIGTKMYSEIKYFIYTWIDLEKSPASQEIDELLQEEAEAKRLAELAKKNGGLLQTNKYDYDVSELGYYRGDRIY